MQKIYYYPIWIRIWHLINALMCLLLIVTGISMQYSSLNHPFIRFDKALALHNVGGIILSINYIIFLGGNVVFPNGNHYRLIWKGLKDRLLLQFKYYAIGIFKEKKAPFPINQERKFNPLQQFSYTIIMYGVLPFLFISGLILLFPGIVVNDLIGSKGLVITDLIHVIAGFIVSLFLVIHIYFCTIGYKVSSHFRAIITGYHEVHEH